MKPIGLAVGLLLAASIASAAGAATVVVDFDALQGSKGVDGEKPATFYAGGRGSLGSGPGPDFGVTFTGGAFVDCELGFICGDPAGERAPFNVLSFLAPEMRLLDDGTDRRSLMNVDDGFTALTFIYAAATGGSLQLWSGLNGTGSVIGALDLGATGCTAGPDCSFRLSRNSLSGVAHSVVFVGFDGQLAGFDDIVLDLASAGGGAVPEPAAWSLMLGGFGLAGSALRRRRALDRLRA